MVRMKGSRTEIPCMSRKASLQHYTSGGTVEIKCSRNQIRTTHCGTLRLSTSQKNSWKHSFKFLLCLREFVPTNQGARTSVGQR